MNNYINPPLHSEAHASQGGGENGDVGARVAQGVGLE